MPIGGACLLSVSTSLDTNGFWMTPSMDARSPPVEACIAKDGTHP